MMDNKIYAVLTGDLVGSSELQSNELNQAIEKIHAVPHRINAVFDGAVHTTVDIIRGDSWQMLVMQPHMALRTALYLRASMKADFHLDSRVSVGVGPVDDLNPTSLARSKGSAFTLSGKGLDSIKPEQRMVYQAAELPERLHSAESLLVARLDCIVTPASASQARFLCGVLQEWKQVKIAAEVGVNQSTVSEGLTALGWSEIKAILQHMEKYRQYGR